MRMAVQTLTEVIGSSLGFERVEVASELCGSPKGGPLSEPNWKRSVRWSEAVTKIGRPTLRVHDLRHTCAFSGWVPARTRRSSSGFSDTPRRR